MNQIIVIHSLLGNYSHIAGEIDKIVREATQQKPDLKNYTAKELSAMCQVLDVRNDNLSQENTSLKEELNELYLKYDQMAAAFGEIQCCLKEALTAAENMGKEVQP